MAQIYCFKCKKHRENKTQNFLNFFNDRTVLSAHCAICNSKNIFFKEQEGESPEF